jgi:hypothetical protein
MVVNLPLDTLNRLVYSGEAVVASNQIGRREWATYGGKNGG